MTLLPVMLSFLLASSNAKAPIAANTNSAAERSLMESQACVARDKRKIYAKEIYQISNRELTIKSNGKLKTIKIGPEKISFFEDGTVRDIRIDGLVGSANLDLKISFSYYNERLFLYWSETFEHRPAMYGLIPLDVLLSDDNLDSDPSYCRGSRGFWVED